MQMNQKSSSSILKKRQRKTKRAIMEKRIPGVVGRPPILDEEGSNILCNMIFQDSDAGNFHSVSWVREMVCQ
jgi:hypothetical protein